jgi:formate hydrogenlyase subunit 3/multisubunit Na+/H+ antiporter MnhD subunit
LQRTCPLSGIKRTLWIGYALRTMRGRSIGVRLLLLGAACLVIVVLTHVAEALHVFTFMGWGEPDSVGHYLDLTSAILGCTLLVAGLVAAVLDHRRRRL